jgi:hypothetical protein
LRKTTTADEADGDNKRKDAIASSNNGEENKKGVYQQQWTAPTAA